MCLSLSDSSHTHQNQFSESELEPAASDHIAFGDFTNTPK